MADAVLVAAGFWKLQVCQMQCCGGFPGGPQVLQHAVIVSRVLYSVCRCSPFIQVCHGICPVCQDALSDALNVCYQANQDV